MFPVIIPAGGGSETEVTEVINDEPSKLIFLVPDALVAGDYVLQVRTRMPNAADLRFGVLDNLLTVA